MKTNAQMGAIANILRPDAGHVASPPDPSAASRRSDSPTDGVLRHRRTSIWRDPTGVLSSHKSTV
jgi:hypothetical protein